jgi:hypothetical protein
MKIEANPVDICRAFSTISYWTRRTIHSISWLASNRKGQNEIGKGIIRLGDELKHGSDSGRTGRVGSRWGNPVRLLGH